MTRPSFNRRQRAAIFESAGGVCHICGGKIRVGEAWEVEHVIPYALTRDNSADNLRPAHVKCHAVKTREEDVPRISKAERQRAKHLGYWPKSQRPIRNRRFTKRGDQ